MRVGAERPAARGARTRRREVAPRLALRPDARLPRAAIATTDDAVDDVHAVEADVDRVVDLEVLARNWWAIALRGVAAIVFGVLTLLVPGVSLAVLVLLFGSYALVDGIF